MIPWTEKEPWVAGCGKEQSGWGVLAGFSRAHENDRCC